MHQRDSMAADRELRKAAGVLWNNRLQFYSSDKDASEQLYRELLQTHGLTDIDLFGLLSIDWLFIQESESYYSCITLAITPDVCKQQAIKRAKIRLLVELRTALERAREAA